MKNQSSACKVFQIGFNKSGTNSLCQFFANNGLIAYHFEDGKLADLIYENYNYGQPLLNPNKYGDFSNGISTLIWKKSIDIIQYTYLKLYLKN